MTSLLFPGLLLIDIILWAFLRRYCGAFKTNFDYIILVLFSLPFYLVLLAFYFRILPAGANILIGATAFLVLFKFTTVFLLLVQLWVQRLWAVSRPPEPLPAKDLAVSRRFFLKRSMTAAGVLPLSSMGYGFFSGIQDLQLHRQKIVVPGLPLHWQGLKIVQLSDLHLGSFYSSDILEKGLDLLAAQKPDLVVFTGDLINRHPSEAKPYEHLLKEIKAPLGVFASIGNHDYGYYKDWKTWSPAQHEKKLSLIRRVFERLGWQLLLNESVSFGKKEEQWSLAGVENWSVFDRFPGFGRLDSALADTGDSAFRILLSHDPSHWKEEIVPHKLPVALTLAGHTHGAQMGIEWGGLRWSPVQYFYEEWAGYYEKNGRGLYVNRGFGYSDVFPFRIGILPEVSLFEFSNSD